MAWVCLLTNTKRGCGCPPVALKHGEHLAVTVRREVRKNWGIEAVLSPVMASPDVLHGHRGHPRMLTGTPTSASGLCSPMVQVSPLGPDSREFRAARWWTRARIRRADPALFDPHLNRLLAMFDHAHTVIWLDPPRRTVNAQDHLTDNPPRSWLR